MIWGRFYRVLPGYRLRSGRDQTVFRGEVAVPCSECRHVSHGHTHNGAHHRAALHRRAAHPRTVAA